MSDLSRKTPVEPPPNRRARAKAEKRDRILAAARHALDTVGYEAMTMAQIAAAADVAAGTVFQYAATKPELLMMVTADRWRGYPDVVADIPESAPPAKAIRSVLDPLVASSLERPDTTLCVVRELLFGAPGPHRGEVVALVDDLEAGIARILRQAGAGSVPRWQHSCWSRALWSTSIAPARVGPTRTRWGSDSMP